MMSQEQEWQTVTADRGLTEKIEILPADLLGQNRALVSNLKKLARSMRLEFGWHYLLDLSWIISQLGDVSNMRIMDAGAGTGIIQWHLAKQGAQVISVDRLSRAALPLRFRHRFNVRGLRQTDLLPKRQAFAQYFTGAVHSRPENTPRYRRWLTGLTTTIRDIASLALPAIQEGSVAIYNQDLTNLADIHTDSLDAVVAVSSLEHNTPEGLQAVVKEIMRVLKPGGALLATLGAARDNDWWHDPSSGWCYTDATLRRLFELPLETPSNYSEHDRLLQALRDCSELRDNLAKFYFQSGNSGMPWGIWDPQYQPVGVCKLKNFG